VYALWEDGKAVIDYSSNGGASWGGPIVTSTPYTAHGEIVGVAGGAAEIAYDYNPGTGTQVFLQSVDYPELAKSAPPAGAGASIAGSGTSSGTSITITITCEVVPCTVTITITIDPPASASAARKKHTKTITLGSGKFTLTSKGAHKLAVHLTKAGKRYLSAHHGRGSAKLLVSDKTNGVTSSSTKTIKITPAKHKHKK
jgi:hypothetical protein